MTDNKQTPGDALRALIESLESEEYDFQCALGPLRDCDEWRQLKAAALPPEGRAPTETPPPEQEPSASVTQGCGCVLETRLGRRTRIPCADHAAETWPPETQVAVNPLKKASEQARSALDVLHRAVKRHPTKPIK